MTKLLGRKIIVTIGKLQLTDFAMSFTIKKNLKAQPNTCGLKIQNLSPDHRSAIEQMEAVSVQVEAGYVDGTSVLFIGDLRTSLSITDGPNIITGVSSGDGEKAHRKARVAISVKKATKTVDVFKAIAKSLGVGEGNIADAAKKLSASGIGDIFSEGTVITGSASREMSAICKSSGFTWSIQDGKLQILPRGLALGNTAIKLTPKTGLIGSPTVGSDKVMTCKCLLIPDVFPGRKIVLESERLQGQYLAQECTYTGDTTAKPWYIEIKGEAY